MSDGDFEILWAERAITRVVLRYARAVDACDFEALRECFQVFVGHTAFAL